MGMPVSRGILPGGPPGIICDFDHAMPDIGYRVLTIWFTIDPEDLAMDRFIQLNLQPNTEKTEPTNLPDPDRKEQPEAPAMSKRLHRLVNKAAHKAASEFGRNGSGIFSK